MEFNSFIRKFVNFHSQNSILREPLHRVIEDFKNNNRDYGLCLEFGVWHGNTISHIKKELSDWDIYGFDSFEGLPERWDRSDDDRFQEGFFNLDGIVPKLDPKIKLIKGWFDNTLPEWLKNYHYNQIDLLHIDCDIYSSTATVLKYCQNLIKKNTIIVFDELINYANCEDHEIKAFYEFINDTKMQFRILYSGGYNLEKIAIIME